MTRALAYLSFRPAMVQPKLEFKLENCLELLETTKLDPIQLELSVEGESVWVDIDHHFFGLTPLNTPGNEYIVE
jgi:hypothetical protein